MSLQTKRAVVAAMAGLGMIAAMAQGVPTTPSSAPSSRPTSAPSSRPGAEYGQFAALVADLGLSDQQKAKVKEIAAAVARDTKEPFSKMMAMHQELSDAYKANDEQKAKKIHEAISALSKQTGEISAKGTDQVLALLTPDQKAKLHARSLRKMLSYELDAVKLTDEQEKRIQDICTEYGKEIAAKGDAADLDAKFKSYQKAYPKVQEVLTAEQKEQIKQRTRPTTMMGTSLPAGHVPVGGMGGMSPMGGAPGQGGH